MSKERPIIMTAESVRATLEGRKTQTRRVIVPTQTKPKVAPLTMEPWLFDGEQEIDEDGRPLWVGYHPDYPTGAKWFSCPYGQPGDRLWVRETWGPGCGDNPMPAYGYVAYRADGEYFEWLRDTHVWRSPLFMPRWASRLTLEIASVRVEQLQDISEPDCCAELGALVEWPGPGPEPYKRDVRGCFAGRWDSINKARGFGWDVSPWVWAISYKLVTA